MYMIRRGVQLIVGLWLFGASIALMVRAGLGLDPWDVLHQGISVGTNVPIGLVVVAVSALVLLLWIPLHQRPGIGTLANVILVGIFLDVTTGLLPIPPTLWWQVLFLVTGVIANGAATGLYIGAALGPGARDGLMTGLAARGISIRLARTAIELSALGIGWLLGGAVGVGTIIYAVAIGPLAHLFIPLFATTDHQEKHHDANVARSRQSRPTRRGRRSPHANSFPVEGGPMTSAGSPDLWELFGSGPRGVLVTVKRDGRPQSSNVGYLWDPKSRVALISVTDDRAKTRNLRRDPRVSLHVSTPDLGAYVVGEGLAELSPVADDPHGVVADRLVAHYRALQGEHADFAEFRTAMVHEKRLILEIAVTHLYGWRPNR